jgi:inner membrane protein
MKAPRPAPRAATLRFALIGAIVLAMLIPLALVDGVTEERQSYFDATLADIANSWGRVQRLAGPFLVVPEVHRQRVRGEDGEMIWREQTFQRVYLPSRLKIAVDVTHQYRHRSIYEIPVYAARLRVAGEFPAPASAAHENVTVRLDAARVVVGVSHVQAIGAAGPLGIGGRSVAFRSGSLEGWLGDGVHAPVGELAEPNAPFEFELDIRGTEQLSFIPLGGQTEVTMSSSWPHPSFSGSYLPEAYDVRDDGFTASWRIPELARTLPSSWRTDQRQVELTSGYADIRLFQPVTQYVIVHRAIKYGVLFIVLTFLAFVCFELRTTLRFHPVQYGVVGCALVLFYLALLSLSEHLAFGVSYLVATAVLVTVTSWYVWAMTRAAGMTAWMSLILSALYGSLYVLLQLEAFALLVGTAVLFAGLVALMASTRSLAESREDRELPA